jgi:Tfp pilus assembly protein PilF
LALVVKGAVPTAAPQTPAEDKAVKEYLSLAQAYRERGDYAAALAVLEKATKVNPRDKDVQAALETTRRACNAERRLGRTELKC